MFRHNKFKSKSRKTLLELKKPFVVILFLFKPTNYYIKIFVRFELMP